MSIQRYENMKSKYNSITPIRGRAGDIRPIDKRRRDWETLHRKFDSDGTESYACRLHNTDCVEYFPNGDIVLRTQGHTTTSTASFIGRFGPFHATKSHNHVWIGVPVSTENSRLHRYLPIPCMGEYKDKGIRLCYVPETDGYRIVAPAMTRKVINRAKAKDARKVYQPFLNWAKTFLQLSDGWIMYETRKAIMPSLQDKPAWYGEFDYERMSRDGRHWSVKMLEWARQEDNYPLLLCNLLIPRNALEVQHINNDARGFGHRDNANTRHEFAFLKRTVHKMVESTYPVHDLVEVPHGERPLRDIEPQ